MSVKHRLTMISLRRLYNEVCREIPQPPDPELVAIGRLCAVNRRYGIPPEETIEWITTP